MDELEQTLLRWVDAGLIGPDQAVRIREHEQVGEATTSEVELAPSQEQTPERRVPLAAEAIGYVGGAIAIGALFTVFAAYSDELTRESSLALTLTAGIVCFVAGAGLGKSSISPAGKRLGSVLWAFACGFLTGAAGIVVDQFVELSDDVSFFVTTLVAFILFGTTWLRRPIALQQLLAYASLLWVTGSTLNLPEHSPEHEWWGLCFWTIGVVYLLFAWADQIKRKELAYLTAAATMLISSQVIASTLGEWSYVFAITTAVFIALIGTLTTEIGLIGAGALGLLVFIPQAALGWFDSSIGAQLALLIVGAGIVAVSVITVRRRSVQ